MIRKINWFQKEIPAAYMAENELMLGPLYGNIAATRWHYRLGALRSGKIYALIRDHQVCGLAGRFNDGNCFVHCADPDHFRHFDSLLNDLDFHTLWMLNGQLSDAIRMKQTLGLEGRIIEHFMMVQDENRPISRDSVEIVNIQGETGNHEYIEAACGLIHAGFDYNPQRDLWVQRLSERTTAERYYLGRVGGNFVAQAHIQGWTPHYGHIGGVTSSPEHRGKGYAKIVTGQLCEYVHSCNRKPTLTVKANNLPAIRLYRGLGFTAVGRVTVLETS